ncbi:hypothetical protein H7347_07165 [Corynebacterium sp. zg-331]|uniref:hypothetical protein n=1 Tax=unclassified Corynebacterium TaxID=2624378 RepID=UPI00128DE88E|nr:MULTISPECIES: hypothetical protein [unclassified Corynebacterium]MBC3186352.1 hypothetical protein [Corynebacterium sp. zg-331]MPV52839.1 hypothetical protein [Corynebacterium sp. zg331]
MTAAILAFAGVVMTALSGLAGSWVTSRGAKEKSVSEQYRGLVAEMRQWTNERLEERDARIQALQEETTLLRTALAKVEEDMRSWRERYRAAVDYIVRLRGLVPVARRPPVPEELRGDVS